MPSLSFKEISDQIKQRNFQSVYLLHGEEPFFIDTLAKLFEDSVLQEQEKSFNQTILYGADVQASQIRDMATRYPMMAPYQLIIIKEAQGIGQIEELENYVANPVATTILVLCHKHKRLDLRKKLGQTIKKTGIEFESKKIYDDKIPGWITEQLKNEKIKIKSEAASLIADHLGNDLSKIANELGKLKLHVSEGKEIDLEDVHKHIGINREYNIFEFQKAIGQKNKLKAYQMAYYFIENPKSNPFIGINMMLFAYFTKLYRLHASNESNNNLLARTIGIPSPFFVPEYKAAARNYPPKKIEAIFHYLKEYDLKAKGVNIDKLNNESLLKELIFKITE